MRRPRQRRAGRAGGGVVKSEHSEQALLVARLDQFHPGVLFHAIPNGGLRDKRVAARLKAEGVKRGVPDLFVAEPRPPFHGLYVEMKRREGGRVSGDQRDRIAELRGRGYATWVARGADDAYEAILSYLAGGPRFQVLFD